MDTKWKCPGQATTVVEKEAGVVEGNRAAKNILEEDLPKHRTAPFRGWPGRASGRGQAPACSGGPTGGAKNEKNLTCGALAFVAIRVIDTLGPIQTGSTGTVINVNLANRPSETLKGHRGDTGTRLSYVLLHQQTDA